MSESGDYTPVNWKGHDYSSAKAAYSSYSGHAGRGYGTAASVVSKIGADNVVPDKLESKSTSPIVIFSDVTGSMGAWPSTMFSKLPYFSNECKEYLGEDTEVCFAAIGDAYSDKMPLQLRPFAKDEDLPARMQELVIEGGGGGQQTETYELGALYALYNIEIPNAINPLIIFIGDEAPYTTISKSTAKNVCKVDLEGPMTTQDVFERLRQKFSVYFIHKSYGAVTSANSLNPSDKVIYEKWADLVGHDHIAVLPEAGRVVDVIFGILAQEAGRTKDFTKELTDRQTPAQVTMVMQSLETIHSALPKKSQKALPAGASRLHTSTKGKKTEPLL